MKILHLIFFFCLWFLSCHDKVEEPNLYWGEANVIMNNKFISLKPYGFTDGVRLNIYLDSFNAQGFLRYEIVLGMLELKEYSTDTMVSFNNLGSNLSEYAALYTFLEDGDVQGNFYNLQNVSSNLIKVTNLNTVNNEIYGEFNLTFVIDTIWGINDGSAPDTIMIQNGTFHTKIYE